MKNFTKYARQYPFLARDIISIDGLSSTSDDYWLAWKDAVLDLACDASDQNQLLTLIKRAVGSLGGNQEGPRAVSILNDLARIVPSSLELILKYFESSFPYWKTPHSGPQLQCFTLNALQLGTKLPQILERIIDFLVRKLLLIDISIRPDDIAALYKEPENQLYLVVSSSLSGHGEKYAQEKKTREFEEITSARQQYLEQSRDYANKLDMMLLTMFEFIDAAKLNGQSQEIGLLILISFEKNLLTAAKPKFVQFLMFYAASKDIFVTDRFLGSLLASLFARDVQLSARTQSPKSLNNSPAQLKLIRITSSFLSSFVTRSKFLTDIQLQSVTELLLEWIGRKVEALTHFSQTSTEISILSSVICVILEIFATYPQLFDISGAKCDARLKDALAFTASIIPSKYQNLGKFDSLFVQKFDHNFHESSDFSPFNPLPFPLSSQHFLKSEIFRDIM